MNESFAYDSIGNRITDQNGNFLYDQSSQIIKEDYQFIYNHDNNGNLVSKIAKDQSKDSFSYSYSSTNQFNVIKITQGLSSGSIKKEIRYYYDVLGRRIQKEVINFENQEKSFIRKYIYNGDNIFAEYDGSNKLLAKYTHSPLAPDDLLEAEISSDGVQVGLAKTQGRFQYLKDALGTVTDIADTNGTIVQRYNYSAYGKILGIQDVNGTDIKASPFINTSFTFTGREWDDDAGIYYYRARYYDANIGRFLQQDPDPGRLQIPITVFNKYAYVGNAPSYRNDPTGKFWQFVILAVIALAQTIDYNRNHGGNFLVQFALNYAIDLAFYYIATSLGVPPQAATSWWTAFGLGAEAALTSATIKEVGYEGANRGWWSQDTFMGTLALLKLNDIVQGNIDKGKPDSADEVWRTIGIFISPVPSAK